MKQNKALKDHPESPIAACEVALDHTQRAYVFRGGEAYRIRTSVLEVAPRTFRAWRETKGQPFGYLDFDTRELRLYWRTIVRNAALKLCSVYDKHELGSGPHCYACRNTQRRIRRIASRYNLGFRYQR